MVLGIVICACVHAQRQPETAQVDIYVPLILDGGPKSDQFQTTLTFVNASAVPAAVLLNSYAPDGSAWKLDLGAGPVAQSQFTVPSGGTRVFKTGIGASALSGWAIATCTAPVQVVATVREILSGLTGQQFMVQPTLPSLDFVWPGDKNSYISIANPYGTDSVTVSVAPMDSDGHLAGSPVQLTLSGAQQILMRVGDKFPNLATGAIVISAVNRPHDFFVATSLAGDGTGYLSSLPNGGATWPISHWDRIWMVYRQVANAAVNAGIIPSTPNLQILGGQVVNAYAQNGSTVAVTLGLSQLISDSPSELAFALAHELGHIYQQQNGGSLLYNSDPEFDADVWGTLIAITAGYDPYAAAGTLAKLSMATGDAGLASQFEEQLSSDAHKSFNTRLDNIFNVLVAACNSSTAVAATCANYKSIVHPNLPGVAPLTAVPAATADRGR
jgi:hypothetical protein